MNDLTFFTIDEMAEEIAKRTESFVLAYSKKEDAGAPIVFLSNNGEYLECLGLCEAAKASIIENRPT